MGRIFPETYRSKEEETMHLMEYFKKWKLNSSKRQEKVIEELYDVYKIIVVVIKNKLSDVAEKNNKPIPMWI